MQLLLTLFYILIGFEHIYCRHLYIYIYVHKAPRTGLRQRSAYSLKILLYSTTFKLTPQSIYIILIEGLAFRGQCTICLFDTY